MARSPLPPADIPQEIEGPRVRIRPYRAGDAHAVWSAIEESREHLAPWLPWVHGYQHLADVQAYIARARAVWESREDLPMGIFDLAGGRFLGGTGLHRVDWDRRVFEIGYWLRRSAIGRGYAREAACLKTRLAFDVLRADRVEMRIDPGNLRSRQVADALSYVLEGTVPGEDDPENADVSRLVYALSAEAYRALSWSTDPGRGT